MNIPQHIVLFPDGNRRWAKKRNLAIFMGHEKGSDASEKVIEKALEKRELERENTELKKMLAEEMLKNRVLSYVCEKKL